MLINAFAPITSRFYLLYTKDRSAYERIVYSEKIFKQPLFKNTHETVPLSYMDALLDDTTAVKRFVDHLLPLEKICWKEAPLEIKRALFYSYDYHERSKNKKIPNVEIGNWMDIPFFKIYLDTIYTNARIKHIRKPRTMINAMISLVGKHRVSVRMGHFHLAYDILNDKNIYSAHWDYGLATMSFSIIHHWLYDDMPS